MRNLLLIFLLLQIFLVKGQFCVTDETTIGDNQGPYNIQEESGYIVMYPFGF